MIFTREDILKIQNALLQLGRKDSEFKDANTPLNSDDYIAILQDGINKKVSINNLLSTLGLLKKDDFINVSDRYDEYYIHLSEAITIIANNKRKKGLVITFQDIDGNWRIYQFTGELSNFIITDYWKDLHDFKYPIINTVLPDEEDLTLTPPNIEGNSFIKLKNKEYNLDNFSGLGKIILRKNIVEVEDPTYGKIKKNILTQDMINKSNTIYVIQYDFTLGEDITIPENCILKFDGGKLISGTINCNNCSIDADKNAHIFDLSITLNDVHYLSAKWFGAKGDLVNDDTECLKKAMEQPRCTVFIPIGRYKVTSTIDSLKNEAEFDNNIAWVGEGLTEGRVWTNWQKTYGTSFYCFGDNDGDPFFYLPRFAENLTFIGEVKADYDFGNHAYAKYENSIGVSVGKPALWAVHGAYHNIGCYFFGIGLRCENGFGCEFYGIKLSRNFKGLDFSSGKIEGKDSGYITIIAFNEIIITDNVIAGIYADQYTDDKGVVRSVGLINGNFNDGYIEGNNIREDITDIQGNPVKCQVYSRRYGHFYFNGIYSEAKYFCYGRQEVSFYLTNCNVNGDLRTSYGYVRLINTRARDLISEGFNNIAIHNSDLRELKRVYNDKVTLVNLRIRDAEIFNEFTNLDFKGKTQTYTVKYTAAEVEQALYLIPSITPDIAATNIKVCLATDDSNNVILDINSNLYKSRGGQHVTDARPRVNIYNSMRDQSYVPYRVNTHFMQNEETGWQIVPIIIIPLKNNNNELIQSCIIRITSEIPLSCEIHELRYTINEYFCGYTYLLPEGSDYNNNYYECIGGYIVGNTEQRPVNDPNGFGIGNVAKGQFYFDTTLNKPIWWTGSAWVDATGATV